MHAPLKTILTLSLACLAAARAQDALEGVVRETTNTATYTYARIGTPGGDRWLAGPRTPLKVGDTVRTAPGILMKDFPSPSLRRNFPEIWFVGAIQAGGGAAAPGAKAELPPGHPPLPGGGANPHAGVQAAPDPAPDAPVARLEGGLTVAEIHADAAKLSGGEVRLRGRVVKVNRGVMGRNWVHLRDGTGAAGTDSLTVTTTDDARVGDVVTAAGKLASNRDFGSGYRYAVLLEEARLQPPPSP